MRPQDFGKDLPDQPRDVSNENACSPQPALSWLGGVGRARRLCDSERLDVNRPLGVNAIQIRVRVFQAAGTSSYPARGPARHARLVWFETMFVAYDCVAWPQT